MKQENINYIHRINCLFSETDAIYHEAALKLHISDSVMYVLYMIHEKGEDCLLSDIYKNTGICKQTINSAIRKLENEAILYLKPYSGRAKKVCLTDKGKQYMEQTAVRVFHAECKAYESWSEEEIHLYLQLMEKYNRSLREQINRW